VLINQTFILNPSAILINGFSRDILMDMAKSQFHLVPKALTRLLSSEEAFTLSALIEKNDIGNKKNNNIIIEYFNFLIENELIFFTDLPKYYKAIDLSWDIPSFISNAIIDIDHNSRVNFKTLFAELLSLGCKDIQIRCCKPINISEIREIMALLDHTIAKSVEIIAPIEKKFVLEDWECVIEEFPRIKFLQFYNGSEYEVLRECNKEGMGFIVQVVDDISSKMCCGVIAPYYFASNIPTFTESQHHNNNDNNITTNSS
jgi:hypothetical protein